MAQKGTDFLDSISESMKVTIRNKINSRVGQREKNPVDVLTLNLMHTSTLINPEEKGQYSLELKFGKLVGEGFRQGIRKEDFDHLCLVISKDRSMWTGEPKYAQYSDYLFKMKDSATAFTISYDERDKKCLNAFTKTRKKFADLQLPMLPYDCHFSVNVEQEYETPPVLPDDWITKLEKVKWVYSFQYWDLELTQSYTRGRRQGAHEAAALYDVEFRLKEEVLKFVKQQNQENLRQISETFWDFIRKIMSRLHTASDLNYFKDLKLDKVVDSEEVASLKFLVLQWMPGMDPENPDHLKQFPGAQPVYFSRRYFKHIQQNTYYVSPKLCGLRYMMLIVPNQGVYFIDPRFHIHFVHGVDYLLDIAASNGITLLDGEMVRHMETDKPVYSVLDIIVADGMPCMHQNLSKRLVTIRNKIAQPFDEALKSGKVNPKTNPFLIWGHTWVEKTHIHQLYDWIKEQNGQRYFRDKKRYFKMDGLLFSPDLPYKSGICADSYFKWNFIDSLSVNLKLNYRDNKTVMYLTCLGVGDSEIDYTVVMKPEDFVKLSQDVMRHKDQQAIIIEFSYDNWTGNWVYQRIRTDKKKPNQVKEIFSILEVIAENVMIDELLYRIPCKPEEDDWDIRMQQILKELGESQHPLPKQLHSQPAKHKHPQTT